GVSCVSCHGRIDQMEVVQQVEPLSMGWCLECHRNPNPHLRPLDQITNLGWEPPADDDSWMAELVYGFKPDRAPEGDGSYDAYSHINPQETCSTCHR
ncbi:MAG: cytochrome C, partial [Planctomycetota bacterium]